MKVSILWLLLACLAVSCGQRQVTSAPGAGREQSDTAQDEAGQNATWPIRSYHFPLSKVATSQPKSALAQDFPLPPPESASDEAIMDFLQLSNSAVTAFLEANLMKLPPGSLVAYAPKEEILVVRTLAWDHAKLALASKQLVPEPPPPPIKCLLEILETRQEAIQELIWQPDHAAVLQELKKKVAIGEGALKTLHLTGPAGRRMSYGAENSDLEPNSATYNRKTGVPLTPVEEVKPPEDFWEIDSIMTERGGIELCIFLDIPIRIPAKHQEIHSIENTTVRMELGNPSFWKISSASSMVVGTTRLLGVVPATSVSGVTEKPKTQAAFLTIEAEPDALEPIAHLRQWLSRLGEKVIPLPKAPVEPPVNMIERTFFVGVDYIANAENTEKPAIPKPNVIEVFKSVGVELPPGSQAEFIQPTRLLVRTTPEVMKRVEEFIHGFPLLIPKVARVGIVIVQAEGEAFRSMLADYVARDTQTKSWPELDAVFKKNQVSILQTAYLETKSGQRAKLESGMNYSYAKEARIKPPDPLEAPEGMIEIDRAVEFSGLDFEIDPLIWKDTIVVDYSLRYSFSPPTQHAVLGKNLPEVNFHTHHLKANLKLATGSVRLLGTWKPEGIPEFDGKDILQAAFLRAEIYRMEE